MQALAHFDPSRGQAPPPIVQDALRTSGQPLDAATRASMESRFAHDFSAVRVHADAAADASARDVHASAYTVGRDVAFARGQYAPHTAAGQDLLVHELEHVVQQAGRTPLLQRQPAGEPIRTMPPKEERGPVAPAAAPACTPHSKVPLPCRPKGLPFKTFVKSNPPADALGVTTIAAGATAVIPEVLTKLLGRGKGVVIQKTKATPLPCTSTYTTAGSFTRLVNIEPKQQALAQQCGSTYTGKYLLTADGEKRAAAGELEHCADYKYAFDSSLGCYAAIVNELARRKTAFPTHDDAVNAVALRAGRKPGEWHTRYMELIGKSALRDTNGWHTAVMHGPAALGVELKGTRCVAKAEVEINGKSFPHVGRHPTPDLVQ